MAHRRSSNNGRPLGITKRGDHRERENYRHGMTGRTRPEGADTYLIAGVAHRFDGLCHPDCENVR